VRLGIRRRVSAVVLSFAAIGVALALTASGHAVSHVAPAGHGASIMAGDGPPVITGKGHEP
jgi:hypothetical protein